MDSDNRGFRSLSARCGRGPLHRARLRIGDWRKCKRKRRHYGYEYNVSIFHLFYLLSLLGFP